MKYLLIIFISLFCLAAQAQQGRYDPNATYPEATTLDEVVYDNHGIPVNATPRDFRQMKKANEREKRKFYGNRFIDKVGDSFQALGSGVVNVVVYVATGIVVTMIVRSILNTASAQ